MVHGSDPAAEVAAHMETLRASFRAGTTRSKAWRRAQLQALGRMLVEGRQELCEALKADLGKSLFEGFFTEVNVAHHEVQHHLDHLDEYSAREKVGTDVMNTPGSSYVQRDPLGVVAIFGAWNYPCALILQPLAGAIAAGNCVLLKTPSDKYSAATAAAIGRLVPRYLDPECIKVVEGDRTATQAVLAQRFDLIFFTGGSTVGRMVAEAAARTLTPTVLELGGQSPCVVDRSADLYVAARRTAWAALMNAGQTCVRPNHVMVHADVADAFLEQLKAAVVAFYSESPQETEFFGRVINARAHKRLVGLLDSCRGRIVMGGEADEADRFVAPTLIDFGDDVRAWESSAVMADEIFGPLVPILRYTSLDQVIDIINSGEKPLALYVFTTDARVRERMVTETSSGGAVVNDCIMHLLNSELPFGGVGNSGMGSYHGRHSFDTFSHKKALLVKTNWLDVPARYPPYTAFNQQLLTALQAPRPAWHFRVLKLVFLLLALLAVRARMPSRQALKFKVMAWAAKHLM